MVEGQVELNRPIRVVVFGGGPVLEWGVKRFICRLEEHPEIEFLACLCQSEGQSFLMVIRDLWRRRRLLAPPLILLQISRHVSRFLSQPRGQIKLKQDMKQLTDRIRFVPDIHAEDVLGRVQALAPDLGLIYSSPILKPELFQIPKFGTLGIHHGKVPEYRGKKTTFWAMYNGEQTAGVTIQRVNAGLDTGEIAQQGEVTIGRRPQRAVWKELENLGLNLYIQAILEVNRGTASYQPQGGKKGKVYRDPSLGDILRFWWRRSKKALSRSYAHR